MAKPEATKPAAPKPDAITITALANLQLQDGTVLQELEADEVPEGEAMGFIARKLAEDGEANAVRRRNPKKLVKEEPAA